jgi:glycerophosphoryl diester phosphodiesterase
MLAAGRADAVHLPVVATRDNQIIVLATPNLARYTDVATIFPGRMRPDGTAASIDFTLAEIRRLSRLPDKTGLADDPTLPTALTSLDEILAMEKIMVSRLGQAPALIIELVEPAWHRQRGQDLSALTLQCLDRQKIAPNDEHIIFMSEDGAEMQRLAQDLLPPSGRQHRLLQMIGPEPPPRDENNPPSQPQVPDVNEWAFTQLGLRVIAGYAFGVAIDKSRLVTPQGTPSQDEYLARAKKLGLMIFVYPVAPDDTIRQMSIPMPPPTEPPAGPPAEPPATTPPTPISPPVEAAPPPPSIVKASDFFVNTIGADGLFMSPLPPVTPAADKAAADDKAVADKTAVDKAAVDKGERKDKKRK